jgi:hypothetical protein
MIILSEHGYFMFQGILGSIFKSAPEATFHDVKRRQFESKRTKLLQYGLDPVVGSLGGRIQWRVPQGASPPWKKDATQYGLALASLHQVLFKS